MRSFRTDISRLLRRRTPWASARRFVEVWWHGLEHHGVYVLSTYISFHPIVDEPAEDSRRNA